jgi:hypothetical protein
VGGGVGCRIIHAEGKALDDGFGKYNAAEIVARQSIHGLGKDLERLCETNPTKG